MKVLSQRVGIDLEGWRLFNVGINIVISLKYYLVDENEVRY